MSKRGKCQREANTPEPVIPPYYKFGAERGKNLRIWFNIVETYTKTSLTVDSDKLPALSGIAKYFQPLYGDRYLAGIWRDYIYTELGWYCSTGDQILSRPKQYRAPTWSWASTDNAVTWDKHWRHRWDSQIQDAQTMPTTDDPTGHISGGFLIIKGQLNPMIIASDGSVYMNSAKLRASEVWFDVPQDELQSSTSKVIEGFALLLIHYSKIKVVVPGQAEREEPTLYVQFLFLQLSSSNPEHYVRVGLGRSRVHPNIVERRKLPVPHEGKFWGALPQGQVHVVKIL